MFRAISLRKAGQAAGMAAAGLICVLPTALSGSCKRGAAEGISLCLNVLIPSLFPMMAAAGLAVKTGVCARCGRLLQVPVRWLFGLDGAFAPVILLSMLGGYPVGARAIGAMAREGQVSEEQARRAALFCVCAGPGFSVSFVGGLYGGAAVGGVLLAAQAASVLLSGVVVHMLFRNKEPPLPAAKPLTPLPFGTALTEAAADAAKGMADMCALVVLFASFGGVLAQLLPSKPLADALLSLLEVTAAVNRLRGYPTAFCAFAVGFGGVCVHFQIFAALRGLRVSKALFFLFRILQGGITAALTQLGLRLFVRETAVFSTAAVGGADFGIGGRLSGVALLTVAVCFLFSIKRTD